MPDWSAIAKGRGIDIPPAEVERLSKPLDALEQVFRPLILDLTAELDPVTAFEPSEDAE